MRPRRQICVRTVCACACAHARHRCRRAWPRAPGSMRDAGARVRGRVRQSMRGPCTCVRLFGGVYGGMAPAVKVALLESALLLRRHWIRPLWARLDHHAKPVEIRGHRILKTGCFSGVFVRSFDLFAALARACLLAALSLQPGAIELKSGPPHSLSSDSELADGSPPAPGAARPRARASGLSVRTLSGP
jgi:hypothetical protein